MGGAWRYVMDAQGGHEVAFHGEFREIVPNERLVNTEIYEGAPGSPPAIVTHDPSPTPTGARGSSCSPTSRARRSATLIMESGMEVGVQEQMELLEELAQSLR